MTEAAHRIEELRSQRFRPYPKCKDSGMEWLGKVPAHWEVKQLRWAIMFQRGHDLPDHEREEGDVPVVSSSGVSSRHSRAVASAPGIVTGRYGTIGNFYLIAEDYWPLNTTLYSVHLRNNDPMFLWYMLRHLSPLFAVNSLKSAVPGVDRNDVHTISTAIPTLLEQRTIADFLDRETAKIDALLAKKERLIELLQEKRTALITRAVTRGLDPNLPMKDSGVEWLGEIPAHWETKKIKRLFGHTRRLGFPERIVLSVYRDYGVIEKSSRDDNFNRTPEDLDTYQLVNPGDLVINKMKAWQGSLGISSLSGITSPDYVVYTPDHEANERFLHHFLRCKLLASVYLTISNGIRPSQWRLEPERFEDLIVFLPPPAEQDQIATFVDAETTKIDALVAKICEAIDCLMEFRTALISAAVTGKIDVREAMPG